MVEYWKDGRERVNYWDELLSLFEWAFYWYQTGFDRIFAALKIPILEISVGFFVREKINDSLFKEFIDRKFLVETGLVPIKRYYLLLANVGTFLNEKYTF